MPTRYVLFWFDVEDCTVTQSDDATKRIAQILTRHEVRATMKVVGQKARVLRERVRYDVIDALAQHAIGYHSNWHGLRPQPAEYLGPLDWLEGGAEFERREWEGIEDLHDLWDQHPVCYGQPGSNWAPQVFPVLRRWQIPTYVSGFGYVGLHAQPFWYGGLINTSHLWGTDRRGREARHMFGLNFELGQPEALAEHQRLFAASYDALEDGGLISIMNHPCTLVLKEWFSTDMKSRELTEAGYQHFDEFVAHVLSHQDVETITADELPEIYPDHARNRVFSADELLVLARGVGEEINYQELDDTSLSAAELYGMFARFLAQAARDKVVPPGVVCTHLDGPAGPAGEIKTGFTTGIDDFGMSVLCTAHFLEDQGRLPDQEDMDGWPVATGDYFATLARAVRHLVEEGEFPDEVSITPTVNRLEGHVDEDAAHSAWQSVMMLPNFAAPKLLEQARLQAWTLKPAILI
jgi:hypothetical protein